jgi:hypothetical protein
VPTGPAINLRDKNFEICIGLIIMVQASLFCGLPSKDANAHLQQFLELCDTIVIKNVAPEATKLRLFPFSLVGKVKQWFYKDKPAIHMEQMLHCVPCQILPHGQNQCSTRKDRQFLANTNGTHTGGMGEAIGVHPSLSPPWDGKLVGAPKFL